LTREQVRIFPVRGRGSAADAFSRGDPLELDYFKVDTGGFGLPNCIIFRPRELDLKRGRRYWVQVEGLRTRAGKAVTLEYLVEFTDR